MCSLSAGCIIIVKLMIKGSGLLKPKDNCGCLEIAVLLSLNTNTQ